MMGHVTKIMIILDDKRIDVNAEDKVIIGDIIEYSTLYSHFLNLLLI